MTEESNISTTVNENGEVVTKKSSKKVIKRKGIITKKYTEGDDSVTIINKGGNNGKSR